MFVFRPGRHVACLAFSAGPLTAGDMDKSLQPPFAWPDRWLDTETVVSQ
jgi:hypothetical protein